MKGAPRAGGSAARFFGTSLRVTLMGALGVFAALTPGRPQGQPEGEGKASGSGKSGGAPRAPTATKEEDLNRLFNEEKERKPTPQGGGHSAQRSAGKPAERPGPGGMVQFADAKGRSYELDLFAAGDVVGGWDRAEPHTTENRLTVRELEFALSASVDHLARAFVSFAAHNEQGEQTTELEEAYLLFPSLVPRSTLKLGKFFFDAGRLNSIHRHEWSFTNAPLVHANLLDAEGASDIGLEWRFLLPWSFWQEITLGVFNGESFGHAHGEGPKKQNPLVVARLKQFIPFGPEWGTQMGFSWLRWHPDENPNRVSQQSGLDLLVKWKRGRLSSFQWVSEVWYRETREVRDSALDQPAAPVATYVGAYSLLEYQFAENWFLGMRFDGLTEPNKRGQLGYTYANGTASQSLIITYKPSEFSKFRITGERTIAIESGERTFQAYAQATFVIGFHPAHEY